MPAVGTKLAKGKVGPLETEVLEGLDLVVALTNGDGKKGQHMPQTTATRLPRGVSDRRVLFYQVVYLLVTPCGIEPIRVYVMPRSGF